jgi:hypothetical protein
MAEIENRKWLHNTGIRAPHASCEYTDTQTDRQTYRHRQTDRQADRQTGHTTLGRQTKK